jgi:hypothetical protein
MHHKPCLLLARPPQTQGAAPCWATWAPSWWRPRCSSSASARSGRLTKWSACSAAGERAHKLLGRGQYRSSLVYIYLPTGLPQRAASTACAWSRSLQPDPLRLPPPPSLHPHPHPHPHPRAGRPCAPNAARWSSSVGCTSSACGRRCGSSRASSPRGSSSTSRRCSSCA